MRRPINLGKHGTKLWKGILEEFQLENEPAKLRILADAAKVADIIAELDEAADEAPLTVKGSMDSPS